MWKVPAVAHVSAAALLQSIVVVLVVVVKGTSRGPAGDRELGFNIVELGFNIV